MKNLILVLLMVLLTACVSNDYQLGDISKGYCSSITVEGRALLKGQLTTMGIIVPVNYCTTVGLVDAMAKVVKVKPE